MGKIKIVRVVSLVITILILSLTLFADDSSPLSGLERGKVLAHVACLNNKGFSYALYLPKNYSSDRSWPVIFCFSPTGHGEVPVRLLAEAAERNGIIVVGSNDFKNGPWTAATKAQNVLWREINDRFKVDPHRSYATGFSGGARAAMYFALKHKRNFAGVISCGAFDSERKSIPKSSDMTFVMLAGDEDFNIFEFTLFDRELTSDGIRHWLEIFNGPHRWPSERLMAEAINLLIAGDMMEGRVSSDQKFLEGLVAEQIERARELERAGDTEKAFRIYAGTSDFFKGLATAGEARTGASRLEKTEIVKNALAREKTFEEYRSQLLKTGDLGKLTEFLLKMKKMRDAGGPDAKPAGLIFRLGVLSLAERGVLHLQSGSYKTAAAILDTCSHLDEHNFVFPYNSACSHARLGDKKKALFYLKEAVRRGFKDIDLMRRDPDLNNLRQEAAFQSLIQNLEKEAFGKRSK